MGVVDILFAVLLLISVLLGLWRGMTRELVSMIAWILIAVACYRYAGWVGHLVPVEAPHYVTLGMGAGIIILLGVILAAVVGRLLRSAVAASALAGADRVLGAVFGALRGALVLVVITALVVEAGLSGSHAWRSSASGPYLERVWHWVAGSLPAPRVPLVMATGD